VEIYVSSVGAKGVMHIKVLTRGDSRVNRIMMKLFLTEKLYCT